MKNKLLKPILLTLIASSLVACEGNEMADASKNTEENQIVEEANDDMKDDNKPADDNIDKENLKDTEEDKENLEKDTIEVEKKDSQDQKADSNKDKDKENPDKKTSEEEDSKLHEDDGKYVTSLIAKLKGEPDEYITTSAYDYKIEDDKFVVSGSIDYFKNPEDYENAEEIKNEKDHKFIIDDKTEFQAVGGTAPAQKFTKEEFLKYLEECKDSGLALIIFVEDGVATSVSISS